MPSGEGLQCASCQGILSYPYDLVPCGHTVCGVCLPPLVNEPCPRCMATVCDGDMNTVADAALCRMVGALPKTDVLVVLRSRSEWWQARKEGKRAIEALQADGEASRARAWPPVDALANTLADAHTDALAPVDAASDADASPCDGARRALDEAAAEGLKLVPSAAASGYRGVYKTGSVNTPYRAVVTELPARKWVTLGQFATAEEAALCYAREMLTRRRKSTSNDGSETKADERRREPADTAWGGSCGRVGTAPARDDQLANKTKRRRTSSSVFRPSCSERHVIFQFSDEDARVALAAYINGARVEKEHRRGLEARCAATTHICVLATKHQYDREPSSDPSAVGRFAVGVAAFTSWRDRFASFQFTHVRTHMRNRGFARARARTSRLPPTASSLGSCGVVSSGFPST